MIPKDIAQAICDDQPLTREQLVRLIGAEAAMVGLTFSTAVQAQRAGKLPESPLSADLTCLIEILESLDDPE